MKRSKIKLNKKEMKEFNKDPLKWICMHIGQEIELPQFKKSKSRYFIVRFDKTDKHHILWNSPDFIEELTKQEVEGIEVTGKYQTAVKLTNWINGGKDD